MSKEGITIFARGKNKARRATYNKSYLYSETWSKWSKFQFKKQRMNDPETQQPLTSQQLGAYVGIMEDACVSQWSKILDLQPQNH